MYEYLHGTVVRKEGATVVLDVGGVGYRCRVPLTAARKLPGAGAEARVWVHARTTDEQITLYGFASREERDLFETIVETVPALGPSRALSILSGMSAEELLRAVEKGDVQLLRRTKGIGEKLASRLVLELRGRLPRLIPGNTAGESSIIQEATVALVSLGYARREADEAVTRALKSLGSSPKLEELIKRSLEHA
ncbi:MAG TPA: Holliday junction branch migration protein RuvA [Planctomycetota bacterium]|nr:Holliday junction branch migration protein RuvA [Planctomycetota bacterium]